MKSLLKYYVKILKHSTQNLKAKEILIDKPWAFFIKPKKNDIFQFGVVQPAFGHLGGGVEAYFDSLLLN